MFFNPWKRYALRTSPALLAGQFTLDNVPIPGRYPMQMIWVIIDGTPELYYSNGVVWKAMAAAATLEVGTVEASAPGSDPEVTNSGTEQAAVLDFVLPRGNAGPQGPIGPQGNPGNPGQNAKGIQAVRIQTDSSGLYTWIYPDPFDEEIIPVISVEVERTGEGIVSAQVEGTPTNETCTVRVTQTTGVSISGFTVLSITTPAVSWVHITAQEPGA